MQFKICVFMMYDAYIIIYHILIESNNAIKIPFFIAILFLFEICISVMIESQT